MSPPPCGCSETPTLAAGAGATTATAVSPSVVAGQDGTPVAIEDCLPCGVQVLERNAYFDGKLMLARDFEAEQAYVRRTDHLHNQLLHGFGTVCGLQVTEHPNGACRDRYVRVEPGVALDCCGREIVVVDEQFVPIRELAEAAAGEDAVWPASVALCLSYQQVGVEPVPALFDDCGCDDDGMEPNRIRETFAFNVRVGQTAAPPVSAPISTQIDWRATLQVERPAAVLADPELQTLYVVAGDTDEGRLDLYHADNHSFQATVPIAGLFDRGDDVRRPAAALALSQFGDRLFVAADHQAGEGGPVPAIRAYAVDSLAGDTPTFVDLTLAAPVIQLLVSPVSGALFALDPDNGKVLVWEIPTTGDPAADPTTTLDVGEGVRHLALPHNGRHLFLARESAAGAAQIEARALSDLTTPHTYDVQNHPRRIALSFDDAYLYVLADADVTGDGGAAGSAPVLFRLDARDPLASLPVEGQVAQFDTGTEAVDLAIAPGDRWGYLYLRDTVDAEAAPGQRLRRADEAFVVPYRLERLDGVTDERVAEGFGRAIDVGTTPLFAVMTFRGERLYAGSGDPAAPPAGQIAVLTIVQQPCDAIFDGAIDGCPTCDVVDECVTLATIPAFVPGAAIVDDAIDNLSQRPLVPSTTSITDVVRCIIDQGVGQGIPGPRGPKGDAGTGVTSVVIGDTVPQDPHVTFDPETGVLQIDAVQGPEGPGIEAAHVTWPPDWHEDDPTNAVVAPDPANANKLTLSLKLPRTVADAGHITALSWRHGSGMLLGDLTKPLIAPGLVVAFDRGVQMATIDRFTFLLWVRRESAPGNGLMVEELVDLSRGGITAFEVDAVDTSDPEHPLITEAHALDPAPDVTKAAGVLLGEDGVARLMEQLRADERRVDAVGVRILADFVLDEEGSAVDGNHVGGRLPTGNGIPGDAFESWIGITQPN